MAEKVKFRTTIEQARGPGATVALVPPEAVPAVGGIKQKRAFGWVNGHEFMTATFPYRGALYVGIPKAVREAAGLTIGDQTELELMLDETPRTVEIAPELQAAFDAEPKLAARFDKLAFSRKRELADPVREAKRPETRAARAEKALARLRER
jgi:bifunctional DNA-binding transcriptional regulator/antitoxin component of YhaV-PrlF toxin-antitoxin module